VRTKPGHWSLRSDAPAPWEFVMLKLAFTAAVSATLLLAPLSAAPSSAATNPPAADTKKKDPTPGQIAERERIKKCGVEWKELKAQKKVPTGMTWPKFWSACNTRLKAGQGKS
jgi:hypothetical protein